MRVLAISDSHIPDRATWLPKPIEQYILSERFEAVVHAGDVVDERLIEYIRKNVSRDVFVVRGNMDHLRLPRYVKIPVEGVELGVVHGDRVYPRGNTALLTRLAHTLRVKILVSGHTHAPFAAYDKSGVLLVNPGSVTGAWGGGGGSGMPSFAELTIISRATSVTILELSGDSLVKKISGRYIL